MAGFSLRFDAWYQQGDAELAGIWIYLAGSRFARGIIAYSWEARETALGERWAQQDQQGATRQLREAALRLGVQRLAAILQERDVTLNEIIDVRVFTEDVPTITQLAQEKTCSYQSWQGRDLFCTAASPNDETAVGSIGLRSVAPTSRPVCR